MNQAGSASAGPDLNLPMNPTEYFTDAVVGARATCGGEGLRDVSASRFASYEKVPIL
jgi:hypothetical protein